MITLESFEYISWRIRMMILRSSNNEKSWLRNRKENRLSTWELTMKMDKNKENSIENCSINSTWMKVLYDIV